MAEPTEAVQDQPVVNQPEPLKLEDAPVEEQVEEQVDNDEQVVDEQVAEDVPEPVAEAPSVVEQLMPSAAASWGDFTVEQREAIHADLVQGLQTPGCVEGGGQIAEAGDLESPAGNAQAGPATSLRSAPNVSMPDGITSEEMGALRTRFEDDPLIVSLFGKVLNGH